MNGLALGLEMALLIDAKHDGFVGRTKKDLKISSTVSTKIGSLFNLKEFAKSILERTECAWELENPS